MPKNMGSIDRVIRVLIAVVVAILLFTNQLTGAWAIVLGIVAVVFVLTSLLGFCPLYLPFKINTGKKKS